jgi:hypothetical protein
LDPLVFLEEEVDEEVNQVETKNLAEQVAAAMVLLVVIRALLVVQEYMELVEAVVVRRDLVQLVAQVVLVLWLLDTLNNINVK